MVKFTSSLPIIVVLAAPAGFGHAAASLPRSPRTATTC